MDLVDLLLKVTIVFTMIRWYFKIVGNWDKAVAIEPKARTKED